MQITQLMSLLVMTSACASSADKNVGAAGSATSFGGAVEAPPSAGSGNGGGGQAAQSGQPGSIGAGTLNGGSAGSTELGGGPSSGAPSSAGAASGAGGGFSYDPIKAPTFDEMPIFEGDPPNFVAGAPAEAVDDKGLISNVSVPTLRRFAMDGGKATGYGYLVFPGGGYSILDMDTHAAKLAERLGPLGIAVFALKYRVGPGTADAARDALLDAKRAIRLVKHNAAHWGVAVPHLGVIGYSAGSHLALHLAATFDAGDSASPDPIEQQGSRPAFVGSMSTWSYGMATSPFTFPEDVPPAFFCHAQDDVGAPIALAEAVAAQITERGVSTKLDFYATGGHSTCHPGDLTMPGHDWPIKFWPWVQAAVP